MCRGVQGHQYEQPVQKTASLPKNGRPLSRSQEGKGNKIKKKRRV